MRKHLFIIGISGLLCMACKGDRQDKIIQTPTEIAFKKEGTLQLFKADSTLVKTIEIEIADNDYQRATGLMHRAQMDETKGMLFVFENEAPRSFYMKNTLIPLDILYIDAKGRIVKFIEQATPMDETPLPSEVPAMYVLELNGGLSEDWVLEIGDFIRWERDADPAVSE